MTKKLPAKSRTQTPTKAKKKAVKAADKKKKVVKKVK